MSQSFIRTSSSIPGNTSVTEKRTIITSSSGLSGSGLDDDSGIYYKSSIAPRHTTITRSSMPTSPIRTMTRSVEISSGYHPMGSSTAAVTGVVNFKTNREREKKDLQDLNERFANYIEKVRFLEAQNKKLASELEQLRSHWGKETSNVKQMYETELDEARKLIDDTNKEKARLQLRVGQLEEQLDDVMRTLDEAKKWRSQDRETINKLNQQVSELEGEIRMLRRTNDSLDTERARDKATISRLQEELEKLRMDLSNETIARLDAENKYQTLLEEIEFLKSVHEQELKELSALAYRDTTAENREFWKNELSQAIRDIQQEYDLKVDQIRGEMETFYNLKVQEFRTGATKQNMEATHAREETKKLHKQLGDSRTRLADLEARNAQLEKQYQDLLRELEQKEHEHDVEINSMKEEMNKLRVEMEGMLVELQTLMDAKLSLELEIAAYRKLLEGEETRIPLRHSFRHSYSPFPTNSTVKSDTNGSPYGAGSPKYTYVSPKGREYTRDTLARDNSDRDSMGRASPAAAGKTTDVVVRSEPPTKVVVPATASSVVVTAAEVKTSKQLEDERKSSGKVLELSADNESDESQRAKEGKVSTIVTEKVGSKPVDTADTKPVDTVDTKPVDTVDTKPVDTVDTKPVDTVDTKPVDTVDTKPVDTVDTKPVDRVDTTKVAAESEGEVGKDIEEFTKEELVAAHSAPSDARTASVERDSTDNGEHPEPDVLADEPVICKSELETVEETLHGKLNDEEVEKSKAEDEEGEQSKSDEEIVEQVEDKIDGQEIKLEGGDVQSGLEVDEPSKLDKDIEEMEETELSTDVDGAKLEEETTQQLKIEDSILQLKLKEGIEKSNLVEAEQITLEVNIEHFKSQKQTQELTEERPDNQNFDQAGHSGVIQPEDEVSEKAAFDGQDTGAVVEAQHVSSVHEDISTPGIVADSPSGSVSEKTRGTECVADTGSAQCHEVEDSDILVDSAEEPTGKAEHAGGPPEHAGGPRELAGGPPEHAGGPPEEDEVVEGVSEERQENGQVRTPVGASPSPITDVEGTSLLRAHTEDIHDLPTPVVDTVFPRDQSGADADAEPSPEDAPKHGEGTDTPPPSPTTAAERDGMLKTIGQLDETVGLQSHIVLEEVSISSSDTSGGQTQGPSHGEQSEEETMLTETVTRVQLTSDSDSSYIDREVVVEVMIKEDVKRDQLVPVGTTEDSDETVEVHDSDQPDEMAGHEDVKKEHKVEISTGNIEDKTAFGIDSKREDTSEVTEREALKEPSPHSEDESSHITTTQSDKSLAVDASDSSEAYVLKGVESKTEASEAARDNAGSVDGITKIHDSAHVTDHESEDIGTGSTYDSQHDLVSEAHDGDLETTDTVKTAADPVESRDVSHHFEEANEKVDTSFGSGSEDVVSGEAAHAFGDDERLSVTSSREINNVTSLEATADPAEVVLLDEVSFTGLTASKHSTATLAEATDKKTGIEVEDVERSSAETLVGGPDGHDKNGEDFASSDHQDVDKREDNGEVSATTVETEQVAKSPVGTSADDQVLANIDSGELDEDNGELDERIETAEQREDGVKTEMVRSTSGEDDILISKTFSLSESSAKCLTELENMTPSRHETDTVEVVGLSGEKTVHVTLDSWEGDDIVLEGQLQIDGGEDDLEELTVGGSQDLKHQDTPDVVDLGETRTTKSDKGSDSLQEKEEVIDGKQWDAETSEAMGGSKSEEQEPVLKEEDSLKPQAEDEHLQKVVDEDEHLQKVVDEDEHLQKVVDEDEHLQQVVDEDEHLQKVVDEDEHLQKVVDEDEHLQKVVDEDEHLQQVVGEDDKHAISEHEDSSVTHHSEASEPVFHDEAVFHDEVDIHLKCTSEKIEHSKLTVDLSEIEDTRNVTEYSEEIDHVTTRVTREDVAEASSPDISMVEQAKADFSMATPIPGLDKSAGDDTDEDALNDDDMGAGADDTPVKEVTFTEGIAGKPSAPGEHAGPEECDEHDETEGSVDASNTSTEHGLEAGDVPGREVVLAGLTRELTNAGLFHDTENKFDEMVVQSAVTVEASSGDDDVRAHSEATSPVGEVIFVTDTERRDANVDVEINERKKSLHEEEIDESKESLYKSDVHDSKESLHGSDVHESKESLHGSDVHESKESLHESDVHESKESLHESDVHESKESLHGSDVHESKESLHESDAHDSKESLHKSDVHESKESLHGSDVHESKESLHESDVHESKESLQYSDVHESKESLHESDVHESKESLRESDVHESKESLHESDVHESKESLHESDVHESKESLQDSDVHESKESLHESDVHESKESLHESDVHESKESLHESDVHESKESLQDSDIHESKESFQESDVNEGEGERVISDKSEEPPGEKLLEDSVRDDCETRVDASPSLVPETYETDDVVPHLQAGQPDDGHASVTVYPEQDPTLKDDVTAAESRSHELSESSSHVRITTSEESSRTSSIAVTTSGTGSSRREEHGVLTSMSVASSAHVDTEDLLEVEKVKEKVHEILEAAQRKLPLDGDFKESGSSEDHVVNGSMGASPSGDCAHVVKGGLEEVEITNFQVVKGESKVTYTEHLSRTEYNEESQTVGYGDDSEAGVNAASKKFASSSEWAPSDEADVDIAPPASSRV